jgi:glycosyltransferase involved in cell wall biosynthesis
MSSIGFACLWDPDPATTWSGTPSHLLQSLQTLDDVKDIGPHLPAATRQLLRFLYARRAQGRWTSPWAYSKALDVVLSRHYKRDPNAASVDAIIEIHDLAAVHQPFWLVQDLSYGILQDLAASGLVELQFPGMSAAWIRRRHDRQLEIYAAATGVFPMSEWLGRQLIQSSTVPSDRVTVVRPGASSIGHISGARAVTARPPRLLFVGRDFRRKGGDLVLDAVGRLRQSYNPELTLTIYGPREWPFATPPREGVTFLGDRPSWEVSHAYQTHDLFVLPSRFEAFGIAFIEALAHGIPCVARDAFAMPEIVRPGVNGALVSSDDVDALAAAIVGVLEDTPLRERVAAERAAVAEEYSWDRAARAMLTVVHAHIG